MTKPIRMKKFDSDFALSLTLMVALGAAVGVSARGLSPVHKQPVSITSQLQSPTSLATAASARAVTETSPTQPPTVRIVRRFVQPPAATTRGS